MPKFLFGVCSFPLPLVGNLKENIFSSLQDCSMGQNHNILFP